jgi:CelD/BcsL family acetyltransferase involved in cellulose biosynthesis
LANEWDSLYLRAGCTAPALTSASIEAYVDYAVKHHCAVVIVVAEIESRLIGALPLVADQENGIIKLRTFGDVHTYGTDFLIDTRYLHSGIQLRILKFVTKLYPKVVSIRLADVRADSVSVQALRNCRGFAVHRRFTRLASYLQVPGTENDLMSSLSYNFRKNLKRQKAKLFKHTDVAFEFSTKVHGASYLEQFVLLESSGWKGKAGTAIAKSTELHQRYRTLVVGLQKSDQMEWHILKIDGRAAAAHLAFRAGKTLSLLKIAYQEDFSECGPGNMLFLEMLRNTIGLGNTEIIDCLTDMPWHNQWRMARREYVSLTIFPRRVLPILVGYFPLVAGDFLRRFAILRNVVRGLRSQWFRTRQRLVGN